MGLHLWLSRCVASTGRPRVHGPGMFCFMAACDLCGGHCDLVWDLQAGTP